MIVTFYDKGFNGLQNNASLVVDNGSYSLVRRGVDMDELKCTCEAFTADMQPTFVVVKNDRGNYVYGALAGIPQLDKNNQTKVTGSDIKSMLKSDIMIDFSTHKPSTPKNFFQEVFNAWNSQTLFVSSVPITPMQYQIVAQITLNDNHSVRFELFLRSPDSLRQDAIYRDGHGVYQVEIGSFVHNPDGTLTNIVKTLDVICGGGAGGGNFEVGEIKTETLDAGLEAEFDVTQRIDGNGKMLLDFYAGIPKGESGKDSAAVHFNEVQDLAEEQKKQARENIGAQEKIAVFSVTIPSSRWIGNRAVLSASDNAEISRLTANSNIEFVSSDESAANVINYNVIASDVTNGAITFTRSSSFTGNITGTIIIISF